MQFERDGKIIRDCSTIWIINFIKNQTNTSPKIIVGLQEDIKSITSEKIKSAVYRKYPHLFDKEPEGYVPSPQDKEKEAEDTISAKNTDAASKPHTPSIPYAYPIDTVCIPSLEREREREYEYEKEKEREERDNGEHRHCEPVGSASPAPVPPSSPPVHGDAGEAEAQAQEGILPAAPPQKAPPCPQEEILALYAQTLPELPQPRVWNDRRQASLRARWREDPARQNLDWWRDYFLLVRASDFLMGRCPPSGDRRPFVADFEWLLSPKFMPRVLEGRYSNGDRKRRDITQMSYEEALRDYPDPFGLHAEEKAKLDAIEISAEEEWT
ncbi:MAG: hypothetical protein SOR75_11400 [Synergistes jonesii]|uniref:hypothetical protein n=1 Tax=Synergistes jonesii TaxID=2754 RepID=UPI002A760474|nr:hypothetical protein [Synergistes jonesii]MDY2985915.1 hypothetical protein [Synergistes jonesii]